MDKESVKSKSNDGSPPDNDDKNENNNAPRSSCSHDQSNDIPNRRRSPLALNLHDPEPESILNLLQTEPSSILHYIMDLQAALHQLQGENKSLESVNKRLKHRLRCQLTEVSEKISIEEPIPLPSSSMDSSNRTPTSFVSVLAPPPPQDQSEVAPSQNVSSLNITPEATKPNSQAVLPPQALPEPRVSDSEMNNNNNTVETIRSPAVATEQEANHSVSSEDISIAMNNIERTTTAQVSAEQTNSVADEVLSVSSTLSTTNIPNNSDVSTVTTNPSAQQVQESFEPSKEASVFLSAKASFGTSKPGTSAMDPSKTNQPLHPFLPYLNMSKRGFLQRLQHKFSDSQQLTDSPGGSSTSWPISAQTSKSHVSDNKADPSRRRSCTDQLNANESRPSLTSLRTQLYFDAQLYEVHCRQLAAGRLSEEPEGPGIMHEEETIVPTSPVGQTESSDSLHVNVDSDDIIVDEDLDDDVVIGGDDLALEEESSSSSSAESADGRGDAGSEAPSSTPSQAELDADAPSQQPSPPALPPVNVSSSEKFRNQNLGGKYGNLGILFRPRPPSGHRYVISVNEVNSRRRNETRLPSWVPTYAQRIECILHQFIDEVEKQTDNSTSSQTNQLGPHLNLVYVRLKGNPPMRLLEFEESSDSEDSCIRSINASTKHKKSCLKLMSREGNIGEYRPKNLSWSQHIYIAQIPAFTLPYGDYDKTKTNSCPGIYYMGEFAIQPGKSTDLSAGGQLQKYGRPRGVYKIVQRMCHCFRCNSPPPQPVESTTDVRSGDGPCHVVTKESFVSYDPTDKNNKIVMPRPRTRIADQLLKTLEDIEQENLIADSNLIQQNFHNTSKNVSYDHNRSPSRHRKVIHPEEEWPPLNIENATENKKCHRRPSPYSRPTKRKGPEVKSKRCDVPRHSNLSHYEETEEEDFGIVADQLKVIQESQDVLLADIRLEMEQLQLDNQCLRDENARLIAEKTHWESLYREMCENTKKMREHVNALKNPESSRDLEVKQVKSDHHHRNKSQDRSRDRRSNRQLEEKRRPSSIPRDEEDTPEQVATPPAIEWEKRPLTRPSRKRSQPRPDRQPAPIYDESIDQVPDRRFDSFEQSPDTGSVTSSQQQVISNRARSSSRSKDHKSAGCFGFLRKNNKKTKKKHKKHKLVEN